MKRLFLLLTVIVVAAVTMLAADDKDIAFGEVTYDFGTVSADSDPVSHDFVFTNNADKPLTVMSASAACGCTRPKYTPAPVKPGETGTISVTFVPKGQRGYINKSVRVRYKVSGKKTRNLTLRITGNVVPE